MQHVSTQKGMGGTNLAKWQTWTRCLFLEIKDNVTSPSHFIAIIVRKEIFAFVITTLQTTEAPCLLESKIESLFMSIIFTLHHHISCPFLAFGQSALPGFQLKKTQKRHHH
jgi:hypothetical protein